MLEVPYMNAEMNGRMLLEKKIFWVRKTVLDARRSIIDEIIFCCFLGGSEPNLADLNVYGILTAIQGCEAFEDLMTNTKIQPWFERMKNLIEPHRIDTPVRSMS